MTSAKYPDTTNNNILYLQGGAPQGYPYGSAVTGTTYDYAYDAMGRLNGMTDSNNNTDVNDLSYGPSNELPGITYFGQTESRTYNSRRNCKMCNRRTGTTRRDDD